MLKYFWRKNEKMKIGLDIDNVISAFDEKVLENVLIEDKKKRNVGIIDKNARHITRGMFDWTKEEFEDFYATHMERIAKELRTRRDCRKVINRLIADGHTIILISHRAFPDYKKPEQTTLDWLEKRKINFHKLVLSKSPDKTQECIENEIDIMVDDRASQCKIMRTNGINCIMMLTKYNKKETDGMPYARNWENLYEVISSWKK